MIAGSVSLFWSAAALLALFSPTRTIQHERISIIADRYVSMPAPNLMNAPSNFLGFL